ncbi:MAG: hypothetical protein WDN27_02810 [Candidatus Saccharibacteria bacterium]
MSLTDDDLQAISGLLDQKIERDVRLVVREEAKSIVSDELIPIRLRLDTMSHKVEALYNDVKDIYHMISDLQKTNRRVASFAKKDLEKKLVETYKELLAIAKREGIKLPT